MFLTEVDPKRRLRRGVNFGIEIVKRDRPISTLATRTTAGSDTTPTNDGRGLTLAACDMELRQLVLFRLRSYRLLFPCGGVQSL